MQTIGSARPRFYLLFAWFLTCVFLAAPVVPAREAQYDELKRHYRIRNVDPKAVSEPSNFLFRAVEYWVKGEKETWEGRSVLVVNREERTAEGDRMEYKFYIEPGTLKTLRLERKLISREEKLVESLDQNYANHYYPYKPNTFHYGMFPYIAQIINLQPGVKTEFYTIFSADYGPQAMIVLVEGKETVTVPAGTFECIRLKLRYNIDEMPGGLKKLPKFVLELLLPDVFIWVERARPNAVIKVQGMIEGFDQPEKVHELVKVK